MSEWIEIGLLAALVLLHLPRPRRPNWMRRLWYTHWVNRKAKRHAR